MLTGERGAQTTESLARATKGKRKRPTRSPFPLEGVPFPELLKADVGKREDPRPDGARRREEPQAARHSQSEQDNRGTELEARSHHGPKGVPAGDTQKKLFLFPLPVSTQGRYSGSAVREKRQHIRAPYEVDVRVSGDWTGTVQSRDLSVGGMFVVLPGGLAPPTMGTNVVVAFPVLSGELAVPGVVRWLSADGFGVQFGLLGVRETNTIGKITRGKL